MELTIKEARELYEQLHELFGSHVQYIPTYQEKYPWIKPAWMQQSETWPRATTTDNAGDIPFKRTPDSNYLVGSTNTVTMLCSAQAFDADSLTVFMDQALSTKHDERSTTWPTT